MDPVAFARHLATMAPIERSLTMSSDIELNEIGILKRREIEARILAPILEALGKQFGRAEVLEVTANAVCEIARQQGKELAAQLGKNDLEAYGKSVESWSRGGALRLQILHQDDRTLEFDVTECRYAALYRSLGDRGSWDHSVLWARCSFRRRFQCSHHPRTRADDYAGSRDLPFLL